MTESEDRQYTHNSKLTMDSNEIREKFLAFFKDKGHTIVESDLLVPRDDPTLLFTGAGMNQFKEQFMGKNITYKRAVSSQKCLRTGDLENVGKTPRHHTFFEMLGNFSFGDYFKKEAIAWAWEFMTKAMSVAPERLWISVYKDDEESYDIWLNDIKVHTDRIVKLGPKDNFWPGDAPAKGPNGPCGPCSEIFYDWGKDVGCGNEGCGPECDCGRFVEVWNLVFTEFERKPDGNLEPLPNKNIDTGMGLERMVSVMQDVRTNFDTDLFLPIREAIKKELTRDLGFSDICLIADHIRSAVFTITDGVSPSNEKQGYVVRKLIRRAYSRSRAEEPFLCNLVPKVVELMMSVYPELEEKREHVSAIVKEEEKRFADTLNAAMPVMEDMISSSKLLKGDQIFKLVDTYGLPLDVITEEAEKRGISLELDKFKELMAGRKEQSRKGSDIANDFIFRPSRFDDAPRPDYSEDLPLEVKLEFILKGDKVSSEITEGEHAEIITSPQSSEFYAESGGQVGDTGSLIKDGGILEIINTFAVDGRKVFYVEVKRGSFKLREAVTLEVDIEKKNRTKKNHTATHLLQAALRGVLGEHVKQSGSFVDDKRLRFDFTHMKKLSDRELVKIESLVNDWIIEGIDVVCETKTIKEAQEEGALSFFGEKYGDTVRVVKIRDRSKEFCGGTHVNNTGDIEIVKIVSESSVASGIRRIEALTSARAKEWVKETILVLLNECKALSGKENLVLDAKVEQYIDKIISGKIEIDKNVMSYFEEKIKPALLKERERLEKTNKKQRKQKETDVFTRTTIKLDKAAASPVVLGGVNFISEVLEGVGAGVLKKASGYLEKKITSGVILLGGGDKDKTFVICVVTPDLIDKGIDAREVINGIAGMIGGGGGGKPSFAQAGGKKPEGLEKAMEEARNIIEAKGIK